MRHRTARTDNRDNSCRGKAGTIIQFTLLLAGCIFALLCITSVGLAGGTQDPLQPFANHLSFSGYKCAAQGSVLQASHRSKPAFTLSPYGSGVIIKAWFQKKQNTPEVRQSLLIIANTMNDKATLARFYVDGEGDLIMEAWYPLPYVKENFAAFLDAWETDFVVTMKEYYPELAKYIN